MVHFKHLPLLTAPLLRWELNGSPLDGLGQRIHSGNGIAPHGQ